MTDSPIDAAAFARLLEVTGGDQEFVDELVDTDLDDGEQQIALLRGAAASDDVAALTRPAHSLKSSSLNVGALRLGELARALEEQSRGGALADAAGKVEPVAAAFDDAPRALLAERTRRAQG